VAVLIVLLRCGVGFALTQRLHAARVRRIEIGHAHSKRLRPALVDDGRTPRTARNVCAKINAPWAHIDLRGQNPEKTESVARASRNYLNFKVLAGVCYDRIYDRIF